MASQVSIAMTRDLAVTSHKETAPKIAKILKIDPPKLGFLFRDKDYQQAEELKVLAAFNQRVLTALEAATPQKEKVSNAKR